MSSVLTKWFNISKSYYFLKQFFKYSQISLQKWEHFPPPLGNDLSKKVILFGLLDFEKGEIDNISSTILSTNLCFTLILEEKDTLIFFYQRFRDFEMDMCTHLYIKLINSKDLMYHTGNSAQCFVAAWIKRRLGRINTCICMSESLCYPPDANTTLLIDYTPVEEKKKKKVKKINFL